MEAPPRPAGKELEDVGKYDPERLFEYWGVYWSVEVLATAFILMVCLAYYPCKAD